MKKIHSVIEGRDRVPVSFIYKNKKYFVSYGYCAGFDVNTLMTKYRIRVNERWYDVYLHDAEWYIKNKTLRRLKKKRPPKNRKFDQIKSAFVHRVIKRVRIRRNA